MNAFSDRQGLKIFISHALLLSGSLLADDHYQNKVDSKKRERYGIEKNGI